MRKLFATLLSVGALVPMFWFDATPDGAEICNSSTPFAVISQTDANVAAAKTAKVKFCVVVNTKI